MGGSDLSFAHARGDQRRCHWRGRRRFRYAALFAVILLVLFKPIFREEKTRGEESCIMGPNGECMEEFSEMIKSECVLNAYNRCESRD